MIVNLEEMRKSNKIFPWIPIIGFFLVITAIFRNEDLDFWESEADFFTTEILQIISFLVLFIIFLK